MRAPEPNSHVLEIRLTIAVSGAMTRKYRISYPEAQFDRSFAVPMIYFLGRPAAVCRRLSQQVGAGARRFHGRVMSRGICLRPLGGGGGVWTRRFGEIFLALIALAIPSLAIAIMIAGPRV